MSKGFRAALLLGWLLLGAAGAWLAWGKDIPLRLAAPVIAAFLLEYPFYLLAGFCGLHARLRKPWLPAALVLSALLPYLTYSVPTGVFAWEALLRLLALAAALAGWYALLPARRAVDAAYLSLPAAVLLTDSLESIYRRPAPALEVEILGHLALIHLSALALLVQRGVSGTGFGFIPRRRDWAIGARHFLYFLPLGFPLGWWLGVLRLEPLEPAWEILGTFLGILWVVALSEEFFFRGLLQQWLAEWTRRPAAALVLTSLLFGAVHLGFRGFPNWRFALVAALAGWFYGRAYQHAQNIRAPMVAHALVVTTWRAFFR